MEKSRGSKRVVSYRRPVTNCDWSAVKREPGPFLPTEREIEWLHLAPIDKTFEFDPFERNSGIPRYFAIFLLPFAIVLQASIFRIQSLYLYFKFFHLGRPFCFRVR